MHPRGGADALHTGTNGRTSASYAHRLSNLASDAFVSLRAASSVARRRLRMRYDEVRPDAWMPAVGSAT